MAIGTQYGASGEYFGHADYAGNIGAGYNPLQILDYLNANRGKLRGINVPGGGGVYDMASREATSFRQSQQAQQDQQRQLQQFQAELAKQQEMMAKQQQQFAASMASDNKSTADVRMAKSKTSQQGLTRRGTTGYFGRQGLRIGSLNVPSSGMMIAPTNQNMAGSFA